MPLTLSARAARANCRHKLGALVSRRSQAKIDRALSRILQWMWKWLGWVILAVLATRSSSISPLWFFILAVTATLYFAFRVPTWCGAETRRGQPCRKNAHGVLMGCDIREHRWQKFSLAARRRRWKRLGSQLWTENKVGSIGLIISGVACLAPAVSAVATVTK